jgi:hypothetical protein
MRLRSAAVMALVAAATAVVLMRRRRRAASPPPAAHLGRGDGSIVRLAADDPGLPALRARAAELRAALETVR